MTQSKMPMFCNFANIDYVGIKMESKFYLEVQNKEIFFVYSYYNHFCVFFEIEGECLKEAAGKVEKTHLRSLLWIWVTWIKTKRIHN